MRGFSRLIAPTKSGLARDVPSDNLGVPQGATCTLQGTCVQGTVKVEARATLRATDIGVIGNVQAENAKLVVIRGGSRVGGSAQVVQGDAARVLGSSVSGDILFDENDRALEAIRTTIGGNLQAFQNTGGLEMRNNRIDGNLQCKGNQPLPTSGGEHRPGEQGRPVRPSLTGNASGSSD